MRSINPLRMRAGSRQFKYRLAEPQPSLGADGFPLDIRAKIYNYFPDERRRIFSFLHQCVHNDQKETVAAKYGFFHYCHRLVVSNL